MLSTAAALCTAQSIHFIPKNILERYHLSTVCSCSDPPPHTNTLTHTHTHMHTGFHCRCGNQFCALHRYADQHSCSFDYKTAGREELERKHPRVVAAKIQKL